MPHHATTPAAIHREEKARRRRRLAAKAAEKRPIAIEPPAALGALLLCDFTADVEVAPS